MATTAKTSEDLAKQQTEELLAMKTAKETAEAELAKINEENAKQLAEMEVKLEAALEANASVSVGDSSSSPAPVVPGPKKQYRLTTPFWNGRMLQPVGTIRYFRENTQPKGSVLVEAEDKSDETEDDL